MKPNFLKNNLSFLKSVERRLARHHIQSSAAEAEHLIRHFTGLSRLDFFSGESLVSPKAKQAVRKAVGRRYRGVPLQVIFKKAEFFGNPFLISKSVLIPRPETEILVQEALKFIPSDPPLKRWRMTSMQPPIKVLDIGTGCGCIAVSLTIARPHCRMTALDLSEKALEIARKNIKFHGLEKKVNLIPSNLFSAFGKRYRGFWDVIVSNPPYISEVEWATLPKDVRSEPRLALDGGPDGLRVIEAILERAPFYLKKGGHLLLEVGAGHSQILASKIERAGVFKNLEFVKDLTGINRILIAQHG